jgi:hypothetical protein
MDQALKMITGEMVEELAETAQAAVHGRYDAFLTRIRLRARRRVMWMSAYWAQAQGTERLAISPEEVNRILDDPAETAASETAFYQADAVARQLSQEIDAADAEFEHQPEWNRLRQQFGLSAFEIDLLSLAVAAAVDPWLRRVYAYVQDDASAGGATPWLACALFQRYPFTDWGPASALVHWRLARPTEEAGNAWAANAPWVVEPYILIWLAGRRGADPVLSGSVKLMPAGDAARLCLYPEQLDGMLEFARGVSKSSAALQIELIGGDGAGKRTLAGQFAAAMGMDLIAVDADALLPAESAPAVAEDRVIRCVRMARLENAFLYWRQGRDVTSRIWQTIGAYADVTLLGSEKPSGASAKSLAARRTFQLPVLRRGARLALWERLTPTPAPQAIADWILTPGEIAAATQIAAAGPDLVAEVCQENLQMAPGDLFAPLARPFTWDDIVLPYYLRQHLAELEQQVRLRWQVYEEWGFERLCPLGRGITALFAGPSGTGKTMAAQILARSLGMRLYRVDLSGVVNKYIGETEKRLKQVFDACERANVVLFFDEADALFGQRTQVKDAHDRFANIEIDYLLQRMEQFDGVAILATNRKGDLDKAFVRRIRFIMDFVPPGPAERHALWRRCLPPRSPAGEPLLDPIDWDLLAQKLNMTGADIAATALGAAFLARAEGTRIGMSQVLHASRRQMNKQGIAMRAGGLES